MKKEKTSLLSSRWMYAASLLVSLLLIWVAYAFQGSLSHFRSLGLLGIFLINLIGSSTLFFPAPAIASVVAGGVIFSPVLVGISAAAGASLGDMLGYLLGKSGKHVVLNHTEQAWYLLLQNIFTKFANIIIFLFAFFPNPFFDGVGILAGISDYPFVNFFFITFAGRFIRNLLLALLGAKL